MGKLNIVPHRIVYIKISNQRFFKDLQHYYLHCSENAEKPKQPIQYTLYRSYQIKFLVFKETGQILKEGDHVIMILKSIPFWVKF